MAVSLDIKISLNSQNIVENTSNVNVTVWAVYTNGSFNRNKQPGTVVIDSRNYEFTSGFNTSNWSSGRSIIFSKSVTIPHNPVTGEKVLIVKATYNTGVSSGTITATENKLLPTIKGNYAITSAPNFTDIQNPTISYINEMGNSVKSLDVCISIDGSKDDVPYRAISKTGSSYTFNLTDVERKTLIKAVTGSPNMSIRFYIRRETNDGVLSLKYVQRTFTIVGGSPVFNPVIEDINATVLALTGDKNTFVKGFSHAKYTLNAQPVKEGILTKLSVKCGSKTSNATPTNQSGTIYNVDSGTFVCSVIDNRSLQTTKTVTKNFISYIKLSCNLDAQAPTTDGKMEFTVTGNYFNSSFGAVANTLTVQYRIKEVGAEYGAWTTLSTVLSGNTYTVTGNLTGLDYLKTYVIETRAIDKLATVSSGEKVVNTVPVFDWGKNDFKFNTNVFFPNTNIREENIGIRSYNSEGTSVSCLVPCTKDNALMLGWGNYNAGIGRTNIYGKEINLATTDYEGIINANGKLNINGREYGLNKVLWSGGYYMTAAHKITLSETVSEQPHGIVLVFSYFSGSAQNYYFQSFFIPKEVIDLQSGFGHTFVLAGTNFNPIGTKYLYIGNTSISGNDNNNATGTTNGITYNNAAFVLRYVIGV